MDKIVVHGHKHSAPICPRCGRRGRARWEYVSASGERRVYYGRFCQACYLVERDNNHRRYAASKEQVMELVATLLLYAQLCCQQADEIEYLQDKLQRVREVVNG